MSLFTNAAAESRFGNLLTASQTAAVNTPATAAASKFAEYLAEKQPKSPLPAAGGTAAPRPEDLVPSLFGSSWDPTAKRVDLDAASKTVRLRSAEFAEQLRSRLQAAGLDSKQPISLSIAADGRIVVDSSNPQSEDIAALFADDPAFAERYRDIAGQNDALSQLQSGAAYVREWQAAASEGDRQALWRRYSALIDRVAGTFGSRMTIGPGTVTADSQQILRRMGIAEAG